MGFTSSGLGPADQTLIQTFGREIITFLRTAARNVTVIDQHSQLWFGDSSALWITQLREKLDRMATVINLQSIDIHGSTLNRRGNTFAAAQRPNSGWRDNTANPGGGGFITRSQGQGFHIRLDRSWNTAPTYRSANSPDSKFQTLVHELTHLIIDTEDEEYTSIRCRGLAITNSARAKRNADSWGYFVEEFR